MKEIVKVRLQADKDHFYLQYGGGAQWEKYKKKDLPWGLCALLNAFVSDEFEPVIEVGEN